MDVVCVALGPQLDSLDVGTPARTRHDDSFRTTNARARARARARD